MTHSLFSGFFDDAAIFPPGLAPLDLAVHNHLRRARNPITSQFIGPLIVPANKVKETVSLADGQAIELSVISQTQELEAVHSTIEILRTTGSSAAIVALEAKVGDNVSAEIASVAKFADKLPGIDIFVELPYSATTDQHLAALTDGHLSLKFRTGGITQELFPTSEELINVLSRAHHHSLRFKLTAGLHRAMRYMDANTGFQHFGFLNIAAATAALSQRSGEEEALRLLNSDDPSRVVSLVSRSPEWRKSFSSFGTCSVAEPTQTLSELGLLEDQIARQFK